MIGPRLSWQPERVLRITWYHFNPFNHFWSFIP
jgi:hypothetical protein